MGILDTFRIKKSLGVLLTARTATSPEVVRAASRLKGVGVTAVPKLIEVFSQAQSPELLVDVLASFLDNSTLPLFTRYLIHADPRVAAGIVRVFTKSNGYDPNRLLPLLNDARYPINDLMQILAGHKERLSVRPILNSLDTVDRDVRNFLLRLVDQLVNEGAVPDLILRTRSSEPTMRFSMARLLARFSSEMVRDALLQLTTDPHTRVRQAALEGLENINLPLDAGALCQLLRDSDEAIQHKAKDILIKLHDPNTSHHLVELLQDEDEMVRRHAVEVLNSIGNTRTIKILLETLKVKNPQVRVRTIATLGTVGGSKLLETLLPLLKDNDEFVRGGTIEIITATKDRRAFENLAEALHDSDMSVKERAAEALAMLGDRRAVWPLLRLLQREPQAGSMAIRALIALRDRQVIRPLLGLLPHPDMVVNKEILGALATLTDVEHAGEVWQALMAMRDGLPSEVKEAANAAATAIVSRFGEKAVGGNVAKETNTKVVQASTVLPYEHGKAVDARHSPPPSLGAVATDAVTFVPVEGIIDATTLEPGTVLEDRYRVVRRVGQGGFGTVMLVEDTMVGEEIILKFLNPQVAVDENMIKRFIHELRYARRISHENVIRIYDFLTLGKSYAISMEYFPSHSLADELRKGNPMPTKRALKIIWDICRGIGTAHQIGIVHRDLKPPNILINEANVVKVVDFGLAAVTHADSRLTRTGVLLGTPTYMAPEQVRNRTIDARTDIYSLGIIMYEMFTGRPPYTGDDPMSILFQHVEGKPTPPREIQPDMSPELEQLILRAIDVDPVKRFQSMAEVRKSIVSFSKQGRDT